jgi:hypothetical protein
VWGSTSLLTQVTVLPTAIDAGFGANAVVVRNVAPRGMETVTAAGPPPPAGGAGDVGVEPPGEVGELLLQPTLSAAIRSNGNADVTRMGS